MEIESIIKDDIYEMIYDISGVQDVALASSLKDDCGLDSLSIVSLIVQAEDKFSIQFDDGDLDPSALVSVGDMVKLVEKYISKGKSA